MRALILGIGGQDGSYLAELLLSKNYEVHGLVRRSASGNLSRISHILEKITLHKGDLLDGGSLRDAIEKANPDIIFNEADQDNAAWSFSSPEYSYRVTGVAVGVLLEIIRKLNPKIKFFQPISSNIHEAKSPYAVAKKFALDLCRFYREIHGLDTYTCIFFNHTSLRQTEDYLLPKVVRSLKRIKEKKQEVLKLGDMDIRLDIGWAPEFMELTLEKINEGMREFEMGTGTLYSVRELVHFACDEIGVDFNVVRQDSGLLRPAKNPDFQCSMDTAKIHGRELIKLLL